MLARPFATRWLPSRHAGTLGVRAQLASRAAVAPERLAADLRAFERFAAVGGFAGERIQPCSSSLRLSEPPYQEGGQLAWGFAEVAVDVGALFVIQNLVHRHHCEGTPVTELSIVSSLISDPLQGPRAAPGQFRPLPFALSSEAEGRRVVVTLEFREPQPEPQRRSFVEVWEDWLQLVRAGGFADEHYQPEWSSLLVADEPESTPYEIIFTHEKVALSDEGFACLVNAFHCLHQRVAKLESIIIS